jgi:hypothetical protein
LGRENAVRLERVLASGAFAVKSLLLQGVLAKAWICQEKGDEGQLRTGT